MESEKVKQNEKVEELFSIERARENLQKNIESKINNYLNKEFKALLINMLTEFGKIIDIHSDHFNKKLGNIKKKDPNGYEDFKSSNKNTDIMDIKQGKWDRRTQSDLENRIMEITQSEQQYERQILKNKDNFKRSLG